MKTTSMFYLRNIYCSSCHRLFTTIVIYFNTSYIYIYIHTFFVFILFYFFFFFHSVSVITAILYFPKCNYYTMCIRDNNPEGQMDVKRFDIKSVIAKAPSSSSLITSKRTDDSHFYVSLKAYFILNGKKKSCI